LETNLSQNKSFANAVRSRVQFSYTKAPTEPKDTFFKDFQPKP